MNDQPFILNKIYKRSEIHDRFSGNRQGGISYPAALPFLFIFSNKQGQTHGYRDRWENQNVYSYTGEGQYGDMKMIRGNLELAQHKINGRKVFLFIETIRSFYQYAGEMELDSLDYYRGPDTDGSDRNAIKFFLKRKGKNLGYSTDERVITFEKEEKINGYINTPTETERKGLVTSRVGQGAYRKSILYRWNFKCAVTGYSRHQILIASHIVPWKDSTNEERLDVNNGILLSPTYDALFDQHLISFENDGKIILSQAIAMTDYRSIGVTGKEIIKDLSRDNISYLERHRILSESKACLTK